MLPGFVNAHTHMELSYMQGQISAGGGFPHFARRVAELREEYSQNQRAREQAILRGDLAMQRSGVVAACDIANSAEALTVKQASRVCYHTFIELFGLGLTAGVELPPLQGERSSYTPHSTYSLQESAMRRVVDASGDSPLSIHFMESPDEISLFNRQGEMYELYANKMGRTLDFIEHGSPARRVTKLIAPHRKVILVHNTCLRQEDIDIIMEHFTTPPSWVICPRSNRHITTLTPPVELLRRNGLQVAIGTDSLASTPSLSPLEELTLLEDVPLVERLTWLTKGGADAMELSHLGEIEVGKRCGLNILSGIDYKNWQLGNNPVLQPIEI